MSIAKHYDANFDDPSIVHVIDDDENANLPELDSSHRDYTSQMDDALGQSDDEEEDEEFIYPDSTNATYSEQLDSFLNGLDNEEVEPHLQGTAENAEPPNDNEAFVHDLSIKIEGMSDSSSSSPSLANFTSTIIDDAPSKLTRPFLHSTISRLRSFVPQTSNKHIDSVSNYRDTTSSPSHLSISRTSSTNNLHNRSEEDSNRRTPSREVFRWAVLQDIGQQIYSRKAASVLGSFHGTPTVFTASGLICIGTDRGRVLVFDFKQQLKCICGVDDTSEVEDPVTAVALSRDHTFIAVGHSHGHIKLFDLSRPQVRARFVAPTSLAAVASGRKEGHIEGSRIIGVDFVGARRTAIVSVDEVGLAFYHSLGKVLFVEATDTIRILGKYPENVQDVQDNHDNATTLQKLGDESFTDHRPRDSRHKRGNTILAMTCLPLGSCTHPTESYNLIALLTPAKLVIVALKPSPRTWFRKHRYDINEPVLGSSRFRGCLAWFPSIDIHSTTNVGPSTTSQKPKVLGTHPILAYSWGKEISLLRISETRVQQKVRSSKSPGKFATVDVGKLEFEEVLHWSTDVDYWAIQWLNVHHLLGCTATHFEVWDVRTGTRVEHVPFDVISTFPPGSEDGIDYGRVAHCLRIYKGRIFLLGRHELKAGTLLSWADRILSFVENGDFLNAIDSCRAYYLGTSPGNRIGLPDDPVVLQSLVGQRMRDLMSASARYAFSEERFTDNTHVTPDGRGIDRTSLFEGLVNVCIDACIVLGDLEFIFEDLFEYYQNAGITLIFLRRLQKYVLDGSICAIPPRITQRLIAIHADQGDFGKAEQLIWHIDPDCLDVHQAITLCRENQLYDALIYVYTRSLCDFVTPLVDLLNLIRQIQRHRREQRLLGEDNLASQMLSMRFSEAMVLDAYKVYTYLADTLSGLVYPSRRLMPSEDALLAKRSIYNFLFFGTSHVWPEGNDGRFILTSEEEGGDEPTYPYVRLLLRFDAEAFLHTMDMAFEDDYFNDDSQTVNRLAIIIIFLEILPSSSNLSPSARTMLNIFIARNVAKYPQSIYTHMLPSTLHDILVGLATDVDASTREDRQLGVEYLLSVYSPHNNEKVIKLFEEAGFYRILRNWYRQDHKWDCLISAFVEDPDVDAAEIFESLEEVLSIVARASKGLFPEEVLAVTMRAIPLLLETGLTETAFLVDKHVSILHRQVLEEINSPYKQFVYLRCLIEPCSLSEEVYWSNPGIRTLRPSRKLDESSKMLYLALLCQYDASGVIRCLENVGDDFFEWNRVVSICEQAGVHEAVIWYLDKYRNTQVAFEKLKAVNITLASQLGESLQSEQTTLASAMETQKLLSKLKALSDIGLRICSKSSTIDSLASSVVEDSWFSLLGSQIDTAQTVSGFCKYDGREARVITPDQEEILNSLRTSVQTTFTSLMTLGSSSALSFPRLFKRLVESASSSGSSSRSSYSEFRIILTGMLDSYRGEGDLLLITSRLVERDLFMAVENLARTRMRGSKVQDVVCAHCKKHIQESISTATERWEGSDGVERAERGWVVQRISGLPFHHKCFSLKSNDMG